MNELPLISVLLPIYNAEAYLKESLNSILKQTVTNFEIIALDDGSQDASLQILKEIQSQDSRIRIEQNEKNLGLIATLNKGLQYCSAPFTARMDADDLIATTRFEKQLEFLNANPDYAAVSSLMEEFDENGNTKKITYRQSYQDIKNASLFYSPVSHAASIFKTNVLKELGYRSEYKYAEDYDLWFRLLQNHKVGVVPEVLYYYRAHNTQSIRVEDNSTKNQTHLNIIKEMQQYFGLISNTTNLTLHLNYCMKAKPFDNVGDFMAWDGYLREFLGSKNGYLNDVAFQQFVWVNFWQTPFYSLLPKMNWKERIVTIQSPFCKLSKALKIKILIKQLIK